MSKPQVVYRPKADATAEGELRALAQVYSFVLRSHKSRTQKANEDSSATIPEDDAKKIERNRFCHTNI
jgi:hypothetical protein